MKDEKYTPEVGSWLKGREVAPPDSQQTARQVAARLPQVRQRNRWWPLPAFRRAPKPSSTDQTTQSQPTPFPAPNGHSPTVLGRTQSMFSPVKAITAGALVFAIGGVLLVAQPFEQQGDSVPAAESADYVEPVEFTAVFIPASQVRDPACEVVEGVTQCRGIAWSPIISEVSDPRLDGRMTYSENVDQYPGRHFFATGTYRIVNDDGAWQGSAPVMIDFGDHVAASIVLVGEGAYEGLYAWIGDTTDWEAITGVIFPAPPPEAPTAP